MWGRRKTLKRWETWAMLDYGDHGLGAARQDKSRVGLLELTDTLRWVPHEGEGWEIDTASITVTTPKTLLNRPSRGLELESQMLGGTVRIRATTHVPGVPIPPLQSFQAEAKRTGLLRKKLLERGATEAPLDQK